MLRATRPQGAVWLTDGSCAPAHNTPLRLERSPPASFKRMLGSGHDTAAWLVRVVNASGAGMGTGKDRNPCGYTRADEAAQRPSRKSTQNKKC